jgi:hypothetical protein
MYGVDFENQEDVLFAQASVPHIPRMARSPSLETKKYLRYMYGVRGYSDDITHAESTACAPTCPSTPATSTDGVVPSETVLGSSQNK